MSQFYIFVLRYSWNIVYRLNTQGISVVLAEKSINIVTILLHKILMRPSPTSADACGEVTGFDASCQEVGICSTRGGSQGMYIIFAFTKQVNKAEPTLALKLYQKSKTGVPVAPK